MSYLETTNCKLLNELLAMKDVGIKVDDRTLNKASSEDLTQYESMGITDLASLFCDLYNWT
jgi:hypothetical protein